MMGKYVSINLDTKALEAGVTRGINIDLKELDTKTSDEVGVKGQKSHMETTLLTPSGKEILPITLLTDNQDGTYALDKLFSARGWYKLITKYTDPGTGETTKSSVRFFVGDKKKLQVRS